MKKVLLEVPYAELSMSISSESMLEKRILTPFGIVDVTVQPISQASHNEEGELYFRITFGGDIERWVIDGALTEEFKDAVLLFLKHLVLEDITCSLPACRVFKLLIKVKGIETVITLPAS
ncbi:MAG: hypothetical protein JRI45_01995 [Deltaproteobacteria bacterium]|nr:hypothetical protein [Deltaproteobacteria bacterium]MBW2068090.1 hypothetical protein [Deltaproteobacteria bacterium]